MRIKKSLMETQKILKMQIYAKCLKLVWIIYYKCSMRCDTV